MVHCWILNKMIVGGLSDHLKNWIGNLVGFAN